ncbi:MAG TPA: hypothetical protein P5525_17300, partial [Candidatus Paceibacterota bacterium]|nr:hypothetical protein [Candidatus Paceibacterota bacterium]
MKRKANQITGANSRPACPLNAGRKFESALCAPPSFSAAVAQFRRSAALRLVTIHTRKSQK